MNLHGDLDPENNNLIFTQNTPAIKFGCKKISSSADVVETVISDQMSPHCDPQLEDSKPIFLHDALAHDVASPYKFGYRRFRS